MPEIGQLYSNPISFESQASSKKSKLRYLLVVGVSVILIAGLSFGYLFWLAPQAQAKEFIQKASATFEEINQKIESVYEDFTKIKSELPKAQASLEEISQTTTDYNYIKKDTEEDIKDIDLVLTLVNEAKKQLEELKKPNEVRDLAEKLDTYYATLETTLNALLDHQKLKSSMIEAYGQGLYDALIQFEKLYSSGGLRTDFIKAGEEIATLSSEAKIKMKTITNVTLDEEDSYQLKKETVDDLEITYGKAANLYKSERDKEASDVLLAYSARNKERNERVKTSAEKYVKDSIAARGFKKLPALEEEVVEELKRLIEEFGLNIEINGKEATPSASPRETASPSASQGK